MGLAEDGGIELFHCRDDAYATVLVDEHRETHPVTGKGLRLWLSRRFYDELGKPPHSQALQDALGILTAKALFEGPERPVAVRLADHNGAIWLDLGDERWRAVRITKSGWKVVHEPPVKFLRARGMQPLPEPEPGGSVDDLRQFVNVGSDDHWALLLGWLIAAFRPQGPYAVLVLNGEQGSAKSTTSRVLRATVDPNTAPLRAEPREARDLMIAATNAWMLAFDNLSRIPPWLSDAVCRLATGGGFATRELYSDSGEKLFDAMRPVLINGIDELAVRADLLDRSIALALPTVADGDRRTEAELWRKFDAAQPTILGALLDAVSAAMRKLPAVKLGGLPRMADFATWAVAAEPGLGLLPGAFMTAYERNREAATGTVIESTAIGDAIIGLTESANDGRWAGTATELLAELRDHVDWRTRRRPDWARFPRGLGSALRRIAPNLRAIGIETTFGQPTGRLKRRTIVIERMGTGQSARPVGPANRPGAPANEDRRGSSADCSPRERYADGPHKNPISGRETGIADPADGTDRHAPDFSKPGATLGDEPRSVAERTPAPKRLSGSASAKHRRRNKPRRRLTSTST